MSALSTVGRVVSGALMSGLLVVAGAAALGRPDVAPARDFLTGAYPTERQALAVVGLVTWAVIAVTVAVTLGGALLPLRTPAAALRRRWTRAALFLAAGAVLLGVGLARHGGGGFAMCCGSLPEASSLAR